MIFIYKIIKYFILMTNKYLNNKHNLKILNSNALIYIISFFPLFSILHN